MEACLKKLLFFVAVLVFLSSCTNNAIVRPEETEAATVLPLWVENTQRLDEVYDFGRGLKFDLYYPTNVKYEKCPLVAAFHGGGWVAGDKSQIMYIFTPIIEKLRESGYAVATIQYRYAQDSPFPAQIEDCANALEYLCKNAEKYCIDEGSVGVMGYSAGAQLAMLSAYAAYGNVDIKYCLSFAGPSKMYGDELSQYPKNIRYILEWLFAGPYEEKESEYMLGSPYYYINGETKKVPLLLVHDEKDDVVPFSQSQAMYQKATENKIPCELLKISGVWHQIDFNSYYLKDDIGSILDFIYKYSKG